jgi:hypothetical protein
VSWILGYEAAWLLLSFAIMVVAVLVNVHEKLEGLEERLHRLEARDGADDHAADFTEAARGRDRA